MPFLDRGLRINFRVATTRTESPPSTGAVTGRLLSLGNVGASQRVFPRWRYTSKE